MACSDYESVPTRNDVPDVAKRPQKKVSVTREEAPKKAPKPEPTEPRRRESDYGYSDFGRC